MTRLLWPAVAILVLIAIGAPCLTFYLLIKEYWAEVAALRHELLHCQLRLSEPPTTAFLSRSPKDAGALHDPALNEQPFPSLPTPQRLISPNSEGKFKFLTPSSQVPRSTAKYDIGESIPLPLLRLGDNPAPNFAPQKDNWQRTQRPDPNTHLSNFALATNSPLQHLSHLENIMIADGMSHPVTSSEDEETVCLSKDYVEKIEKRALDSATRIEACRRCLKSSRRKESHCGGGPSWKDYKRKEKLARKEMRKEKRRRRKKEKRSKEEEKGKGERQPEGNGASGMMSESSIQNETVPSQHQSDTFSFSGMRSSDYQSQSNHNMRENHRASTDFRRGFNQKILRMDEALMQFTETQSAFCKELRDNLGGSLEKRGQELGALSEQVAALVRTTTSQVAMIEKLASDQVYAGQTSIEKTMEKLQTLKEEQMRSIQNFHKKTFLPAMVTLTSLLGEQASSVTNMGVDLITKVEMLQDSFLTFSTQQGDSLIKLSEEVNMFASKHGNLIMRSRDHAKHLHINTENFIRELQTRMNNVVKELVLVRLQSQSFVSINENTFHEISASLNKTEDMVDALSEDLQRRIEKAKEEEGEFRSEFRQETDLITDRTETGISEVLMRNHAAMTQIGEAELETRAFANAAEAAWNEMYVNQETELRQEADMLANNLRSHNHHTQNILTGLQGTAGTHEQVLEQQRMDFQGFIRKRQDALDTQCSSLSDWTYLMSSELRRRDEDLHKFLSEELQLSRVTVQDIPRHDDFLVSRLPDGTLLYDSSSHSFPSSRRSASNVTTARSWEVAYEITEPVPSFVNSSTGQSSSLTSPDDSSLPKSSPHDHHSLPSPTQMALLISSQEELERERSSNSSTRKEDVEKEEEASPSRGDLAGVQRSGQAKVKSNLSGEDALSNDIKGAFDYDFDNTITHQSDQGMNSNFSRVDIFGNKANCITTNTNKNLRASDTYKAIEDDDKGYKNLQTILLEAKNAILKFQKELDVNEIVREVRNPDWSTFTDTEKTNGRNGRSRGRSFFNFKLPVSKRMKGSSRSATENGVEDKQTNNTRQTPQTTAHASSTPSIKGLKSNSSRGQLKDSDQ